MCVSSWALASQRCGSCVALVWLCVRLMCGPKFCSGVACDLLLSWLLVCSCVAKVCCTLVCLAFVELGVVVCVLCIGSGDVSWFAPTPGLVLAVAFLVACFCFAPV